MFKARLKSCSFTFLLGLALAVTSQLANAAPFQKGYALVGDHLLEVVRTEGLKKNITLWFSFLMPHKK
ncbi:MAG: hypothetical protein EB134_05180 [Actinobacteria bacterium]|nr:hypothetical protein [Actinomycetota bacterium]